MTTPTTTLPTGAEIFDAALTRLRTRFPDVEVRNVHTRLLIETIAKLDAIGDVLRMTRTDALHAAVDELAAKVLGD